MAVGTKSRLAIIERRLSGVIAGGGGGGVPTSRTIATTAPLTGGGDLSANRTLAISAATTGAAGSMSASDKTKLDGIATGATANATDASLRDRSTHTGTQSADSIVDGSTNKAYTGTEQTKLAGIATGATANSSDATLLARANHTGTQTASTISDFDAAVDARIPVSVVSLSSDATANATTTGVEITGLQKSLVAGTYTFKYVIRYQSAATTTGVKFGVNYTGTSSSFIMRASYLSTGTTATTGAADQVSTSGTFVMYEGSAARSGSTTSPNLGVTASVDTANADMMMVIEGMLIATGSGDLELWHASEVAASSTVKAGSSLVLTKVG